MIPCLQAVVSGICKADCCGPVPFGIAEFSNLLPKACVQPEKVEYPGGGGVIPLTEDGYCPFLNREARRCVIYGQRPHVCRLYGTTSQLPCPYYAADGVKRTRAERRRMKRQKLIIPPH